MGVKQNKPAKASAASGKQSKAVVAEPGKIESLVRYFEDAKKELGKVSWPTKKEVRATSLAVLALVVIMALFLGVVDFILAYFIEAILAVRI